MTSATVSHFSSQGLSFAIVESGNWVICFPRDPPSLEFTSLPRFLGSSCCKKGWSHSQCPCLDVRLLCFGAFSHFQLSSRDRMIPLWPQVILHCSGRCGFSLSDPSPPPPWVTGWETSNLAQVGDAEVLVIKTIIVTVTTITAANIYWRLTLSHVLCWALYTHVISSECQLYEVETLNKPITRTHESKA